MTARLRDFSVLLLLGLAIFAAFHSSLQHGLLAFDDAPVLVQNPRLHPADFSNALALFGEIRDEAYLPLWYLAYYPEFLVAPDNATAIHAASLLWHLLAAWLVYLLAEVLLASRLAALCAALLFACHPLCAESVAWASGRKDQVSLVLLLLALLAAQRCWRRGAERLWLTAALIFAGSFAKGSMVVAPLLAAVMGAALQAQGRIPAGCRWLRSLWLPLLAAALPAALHWSIARSQGTAISDGDLPARMHLGAAALLRYLQHMLWPTGLTIHAAEPQFSMLVLAGGFAAALALIACWWRWRSALPVFALALIWPLLALLPFNNVLPETSNWFADRYASMALPGFCLLVAACLQRGGRVLLLTFGTALTLALVLLCHLRTREFESDQVLFGAAAAREPADPVIALHLAEMSLVPDRPEAGRTAALFTSAADLAQKARRPLLELRAHLRLGDLLLAAARPAEAAVHHQRALELVQQHGEAARRSGLDVSALRVNAASAWLSAGHADEARAILERIPEAEFTPELNLLQARMDLRAGLQQCQIAQSAAETDAARGTVRSSLERLRQAGAGSDAQIVCTALKEAGETLLAAEWIPARYATAGQIVSELTTRFPQRNEGWLLSSRLREEGGDPAGALKDLLHALALNVRETSLFARAAEMLQSRGENRRAAEILHAGLRVDPESVLLRTELVRLLLGQSQRHLAASDAEKALKTAEEAVRWLPDAAEAQVALGDAFAALGRWEPAELAWQKALDLAPDLPGARRGMARFLQARGLGTLADLQGRVRAAPAEQRAALERDLRDRVMADFRRALELGGDWDELRLARRHVSEVAERDRRSACEELLTQAKASLAAGNEQAATELARNALRIDGTSTAAHFLMARLALGRNDGEAAVQELNTTLSLDPEHLGALAAAARLQFSRGEHDAARRHAQQFIRLAEKNPDPALEADLTALRELLEKLKQ